MTQKKIVHYTPTKEDFISVGQSAWVHPIDHPDKERVSNKKPVITSEVLRYDKSSGEFETLNTVYKRPE